MKTIIKVTQDHIDKGRSSSAFSCPIALAVKDTVNAFGADEISVTRYTIKRWANKNTPLWERQSPETVSDFVYAFDDRKEVKPFEFELDI